MEVKNIKGKMDYIDVYMTDDRVARILGEMIHGGFIGEKSSMRQWKVPEGQPITEEEKQEIMKAVIEKTKGSHMVIVFE